MQFSGLNPWVSMWSQPRMTMRALLETDPKYCVLLLATAYSLQFLFYIANFYSLGFGGHFYAVLFCILILSPFAGWLWLYFSGWVLHATGKWLGGKVGQLPLRCALAWSKLPLLLCVAMWLILSASHSETVFIQSAIGSSLVFVNLIAIILGIWSFFLLVQSVREVQSFTFLRSLLNVILFTVVSFVLILLATTLVGMVVVHFIK